MNADEIARILDTLGERLGPAGQYVFELAMRQVYINAVISGAMAVGAFAGAVFLWQRIASYRRGDWARWNALPESEKSYTASNGKPDDIAGNGGAVLLYLIPMGTLVAALVLVRSALTGLLNPEYAALTDLLSRIVP